jgi:hypothetical protein
MFHHVCIIFALELKAKLLLFTNTCLSMFAKSFALELQARTLGTTCINMFEPVCKSKAHQLQAGTR